MKKYIHEDDTHTLDSPRIIVPYLLEQLKPTSVVDVGCGTGTFLKVFKEHGIRQVLGLDGKWVDRKKLLIDENEFLETDLEQLIFLDRKFDLVLSLEVAEHLSEEAAETFVESLIAMGKIIVFGAATTAQGGQNHINEQEFAYWEYKFAIRGYRVVDLFRPHFWNMDQVQWWYKQNMFLLLHNTIPPQPFESHKDNFSSKNVLIHPGLYYERIRELEKASAALGKLGAGEGGNFNLYLKLLYRSFKKSFRK